MKQESPCFSCGECQNGYGVFGGCDIYELVAEWNRDCIPENNISYNKDAYQNILGFYQKNLEMVKEFVEGHPESYMKKKYGDYWKREVGIFIACYDAQNSGLKYPIKICKKRPQNYETIRASKRDPNQGCY